MKPESREFLREGGAAPHARAAYFENEATEGPPVLVILTFFLALASVPVVFIGGQFPWFILAPLFVLLMFLHLRNVEASMRRKAEDAT